MTNSFFRLKNYCDKNPQLSKFLRDHPCKRTGYIQLDFVIISHPENSVGFNIVGLFYLDTYRVREYSEEIIVQDFIAEDTRRNSFVRYSGEGKKDCSSDNQHIKCFCSMFGRFANGKWGQYGCSRKSKTTNHRYNICSRALPKEYEAKNIIKTALVREL